MTAHQERIAWWLGAAGCLVLGLGVCVAVDAGVRAPVTLTVLGILSWCGAVFAGVCGSMVRKESGSDGN
jgi:hypothetical protein